MLVYTRGSLKRQHAAPKPQIADPQPNTNLK